VVDPGRDSLPQNGDGGIAIARRSKHLWTGELHGAIPHSLQVHSRAGRGEAAAKICLFSHFVSPLFLLCG
jgi:hypothetical protein